MRADKAVSSDSASPGRDLPAYNHPHPHTHTHTHTPDTIQPHTHTQHCTTTHTLDTVQLRMHTTYAALGTVKWGGRVL